MNSIQPAISRPRRKRLRIRILAVLIISIGCAVAGYFLWSYRGPTPPIEIYHGITYSCERLNDEPQGGGRVYCVKVDLAEPGIQIYTTPLDREAVAHGWEYKRNYARRVVREQNLAVAVNGTMFAGNIGILAMRGDFARGLETLISDHVADHPYQHGWLLGFDDAMVPAINEHRPPTPEDLARARWGIVSQQRILVEGKVNPWGDVITDHRTVLGISADKHTLWLACFEKASYQFAAQYLARQGASDAIILDGGSSTAMALGPDAKKIRPGDVVGDWRPAANFFGVRARPIDTAK